MSARVSLPDARPSSAGPLPAALLRVVAAALAFGLVGLAAADAGAARKKKGGGKKDPASSAPATAAPAMDKEKEAKRHFDSGNLFYESGDFLAAAAEFLVAYELVPKANLLYNAALAYEEAKDTGKALETYRRYLKSLPDAPNRAEVEARIEKLGSSGNRTVKLTTKPEGASIWVDLHAGTGSRTPYTVSLEIGSHRLFIEKKGFEDVANEFTVTEESEGATIEIELTPINAFLSVEGPDGAEVLVDGKSAGTTPLAPLELRIGEHDVVIRLAGGEEIARRVDLARGETVVVRAGGAALGGLRLASLGILGAGIVAGGATAGIFGGLSFGLHGRLRRCADLGMCVMSASETELAISRGKTYALIADVAWIGGTALAVTGAVLFLVSGSGGGREAPRDEYAGAPRPRLDAFGVVPAPGGGALTLAGSF